MHFSDKRAALPNVRFGDEVEVLMTRIAVRPLNHLRYCP
jgi:hypothetical protein